MAKSKQQGGRTRKPGSGKRSGSRLPELVREPKMAVERTQLGVRIEKRLAKVLKGIAEHGDMTVGQMLEDILLHVFGGHSPFLPETLEKIAQLKKVYDLDYDVHDSYRFEEKG